MNNMKSAVVSILITVFLMWGCDGGSEESPDVQQLLTSGVWKMKSITVDGVNKNDLFTDFTVAFSTTAYTSTNGAPVWPATGTWSFADTEHKLISRNDGIVVTLEIISENELTLRLQWNKTSLGSGRSKSISGNHVFVLSR